MVDKGTGKKYKKKVTSSLNHDIVADICLLEGAILPEPRTSFEKTFLTWLPTFNNFLLGINNRDRVDRWLFNSDRDDVTDQQIHWADHSWDDVINYCAVMRADTTTLSATYQHKLVHPITCDGSNMVLGIQAVCEKNEGIYY